MLYTGQIMMSRRYAGISKALSIGYCCLLLSAAVFMLPGSSGDDGGPGDRKPTRCEVCKYLASELDVRLAHSGRTHDVLHIGHRIDAKDGSKRQKKYRDSETRLIEALDHPPVCDEILKYNVHAEREGSLRYAKGISETMQTLHGLKDKGVKVELGIPFEMWDSPHAEVTDMKRQCETMKERYEEVIEDWYFHHQNTQTLASYLCQGNVLEQADTGCLTEVSTVNDKGDVGEEKINKKKEKEDL